LDLMDAGDEILLLRCVRGDETAFVQLVRRYRQPLIRYVRWRIGDPDDAEDVFQETLIAAWVGLSQVRDSGRIRPWLMHVARNRCRDYFRVRGRQDVPLDEQALQDAATRSGLHQHRQGQVFADVLDALDALETAPPAAREAARRFYLEGLTVAEIAAETHSPPGTVKRRLFQARSAARASLGIPVQPRSSHMETTETQTEAVKAPAFPADRPAIDITELAEPPFAVDCQELRCWSIIPRVGAQAAWADYHPRDWTLREVNELRALRPATVHKVAGVEMEVRTWKPESGWQPVGTLYGRLTDEKAEYLAVHLPHEQLTQVQTFLDDTFDWDWGTMPRALADRGQFARQADGSLTVRDRADAARGAGCGHFAVTIGGKCFPCLRVLQIDVTVESDAMTASYLTREGRTVLVRHYCRPDFPKVAESEVILDETERLVIDGIPFVHWYDTVTNLAL